MKKGTQLLEVYALEIQMYTEQKNNKKLKALYEQSLHIKSAIPHPLIMGVIRGRERKREGEDRSGGGEEREGGWQREREKREGKGRGRESRRSDGEGKSRERERGGPWGRGKGEALGEIIIEKLRSNKA